ncbi:MAG: 3-hydroxyacyl-CoA dehydrogenase/enoyl-CoA hydratase family protein [Desulfatitalea sp.]|nr:3-hydroxyacyl-CoA dehydrogenase/enoyl-CoA hydratase family protein [Desulfatitalea sp.]NNK01840.1 3-hydroxyacyl-CoA dehydrogenase/enoyl-CoA hydratase family protein [Desulfatitalea sp.]
MSESMKIGVIGAGNMGSGIVQKIAHEGLHVVMIDVKDEFVDRGMATIKSQLEAGVQRKLFSAGQAEQTLSRITGTTDFGAVADADLIVEAVFEDKQVKSDLFKKLDDICEDKTILATNTSSFYVKDFAAQVQRPDRFIGLHYFFHPAKNRLLEIIPHDTTSQETLDKSALFAKLHGKTAIVVKDAPGFAVNRFFVPFLNEAGRMLEEGVADIATIEAAAKHAFKIGMGPFELMNVTGIPITVHSTQTLGAELGAFYGTCDIIRLQMEKNEPWDLAGPVAESKVDAVADRFLGVCLGVAAALVDEGVATMEDTDRGAKIGLRWQKGPFEIMNRIGIDKTFQVVKAVSDKYPDFQFPELIQKQKASGAPFAFSLVDLEIKKDIAFITINRPEAMNALNEAVIDQMTEKFADAELNPSVKGIVFQGAGKAFVAGADIRYFVDHIKADTIQNIVEFTRKGHALFLKIEKSAKKTIALLDGLSLGGGSELALACQQILATANGAMGFPETGIGIIPGLGGMLRMAKQVGPALTKYYTFTGASLSAEDAHTLGVVTAVVSPANVPRTLSEMIAGGKTDKYRSRSLPGAYAELEKTCNEENIGNLLSGKPLSGVSDELAARTAKMVGRKSPAALRTANDIIDQQATLTIEQGVSLELSRLTEIFETADALEGLSSALERRRPGFKNA